MTTEKNIALTIWTFISKMMSLLFNTLSRFVIAFLPRSKCLLILWLQSLQWFLEPKKIKYVAASSFPPSVCHEVMGLDAMILHTRLLQSRPTLFDSMDCSISDSSVHGDSPGNNTGVGCHFLLQGILLTQGLNPCLLCFLQWQACSLPLKVKVKSLSWVRLFALPWIAA